MQFVMVTGYMLIMLHIARANYRECCSLKKSWNLKFLFLFIVVLTKQHVLCILHIKLQKSYAQLISVNNARSEGEQRREEVVVMTTSDTDLQRLWRVLICHLLEGESHQPPEILLVLGKPWDWKNNFMECITNTQIKNYIKHHKHNQKLRIKPTGQNLWVTSFRNCLQL